MPRPRLALALLTAFLVACACGSFGDEPTAEPTVPVPAAEVLPVPPAAAPPPPAPAEPAPALAVGAVTREAAVAAYLGDCHATFVDPAAAQDPDAGVSEECAYLEFDQNCSPDPSGCWDKGQACEAGCTDSCGTCQSTCAGVCDGCKAGCGEDATCLHTCADARATCRDACLSSKSDCVLRVCPAAEEACSSAFATLRAERCPDCDAISQCLIDSWNNANADGQQACAAKFPADAPECVSWCDPGT